MEQVHIRIANVHLRIVVIWLSVWYAVPILSIIVLCLLTTAKRGAHLFSVSTSAVLDSQRWRMIVGYCYFSAVNSLDYSGTRGMMVQPGKHRMLWLRYFQTP